LQYGEQIEIQSFSCRGLPIIAVMTYGRGMCMPYYSSFLVLAGFTDDIFTASSSALEKTKVN